MKLDDIKSIGVIGSGQMGSGIAQVLAMAGWRVLLVDLDEGRLAQAVKRIREGVARAVEKEVLRKEEAERVTARVHISPELDHVKTAQLVIEAVSEDARMKEDLFRNLGRICAAGTVLASNTSSIPITKLGAASGRPEVVIGIHFMNPVPVMQLVEIVEGPKTSRETVGLALDLVNRLGKTSVVSKDVPGFIVNRILMPMINEAVFALEQGVATPEDIDLAMTAGTNHPVGPLALADRIGLDTVLAICEVLQHELGDAKFAPCPLLRKHVAAGRLGRKTGRGFYVYE